MTIVVVVINKEATSSNELLNTVFLTYRQSVIMITIEKPVITNMNTNLPTQVKIFSYTCTEQKRGRLLLHDLRYLKHLSMRFHFEFADFFKERLNMLSCMQLYPT